MHFIFMYGPPAAGKLTVATELAQMTGYKLLDNHRALDYLAELFPRSEPRYDAVRSALGRKLRIEVFAAAASAGVDMITTFAPISPGTVDFMRAVRQAVENAGGTMCMVQLLPSRQTLHERVADESRKDRKIDNVARWDELIAPNPEAFATFPDMEHLVLDNSALSPQAAAQKIVEHYRL
jgi:tRNA uridine 5-carbamoylmethylation protein Kti12